MFDGKKVLKRKSPMFTGGFGVDLCSCFGSQYTGGCGNDGGVSFFSNSVCFVRPFKLENYF